jgi:hypothetical protein
VPGTGKAKRWRRKDETRTHFASIVCRKLDQKRSFEPVTTRTTRTQKPFRVVRVFRGQIEPLSEQAICRSTALMNPPCSRCGAGFHLQTAHLGFPDEAPGRRRKPGLDRLATCAALHVRVGQKPFVLEYQQSIPIDWLVRGSLPSIALCPTRMTYCPPLCV